MNKRFALSIPERLFLMFAAARGLIDTGPVTSTLQALSNIGVIVAVVIVASYIFKDLYRE